VEQKANLRALLLDRFMNRFVPGGGLMVLAAVCGILVFLVIVTIPLLLRATSSRVSVSPVAGLLTAGFVEASDEAWWIGRDGAGRGATQPEPVVFLGLESFRPDAAMPVTASTALSMVSNEGKAVIARVVRDPKGDVKAIVSSSIDMPAGPVERFACARDDGGEPRVLFVRDGRAVAVGLGGMGDAMDVTLGTSGVTAVALSSSGTLAALGTDRGDVDLWDLTDLAEPRRIQTLPGPGAPSAALGFLIGDETLVVADSSGRIDGWFRIRHVTLENSSDAPVEVAGDLVPAKGSATVPDRDHSKSVVKGGAITLKPGGMPWMRTKSFPALPATPRSFAASGRNKSFAIGCEDGSVHVYHGTTETRSLSIKSAVSGPAWSVAWNGRADRLAVCGEGVSIWSVKSPHPEVTLSSLFAPVWYEGYCEPEIIWQSSSGTQDTEPKLSLWPLIFGTLKGTLYAMVFSIPVALGAAIYISRFAHPLLKLYMKPAIEIMSGIPSVVVGMIAAIWFAPILERYLFGAGFAMLLFPAVFASAVWLSGRLVNKRSQGKGPGRELLGAGASLAVTLLISWTLGPAVERLLFGGDFRQWLYESLSVNYDIRNGFIVGVALGFAVIPVIFTIAEDAISGVPQVMTNAAMALGATKWQTIRYVILPAAASGVFAAIVLGLGRAAGETMIVVMAAGNTPILDPSPWNGMRTMSAAMAIEIPEAPYNGSLYRVLFLTGLILFGFTATLNTVAELVGSRLRSKYGRF
jgi:phosphate transport system permease protein